MIDFDIESLVRKYMTKWSETLLAAKAGIYVNCDIIYMPVA